MDSLTPNAYAKDRSKTRRVLLDELEARIKACWCSQVDWRCENCESAEKAAIRLMLAKAA